MKHNIFKGVATAIVTPFDENDNIDFDVFKELIEFQINSGVNAIVFLGTTGEASTLDYQERSEVIKFAVETVNKRVPVIIGTGSNSTKIAVKLTKEAESLGADAALVVTPYYNKATQKGLVSHYKKIAKNTNLPIILYSVPGRTGVNILPETALELSKVQNIVAIKEASGNISQVSKIKNLCGDNLDVYSGNDDQIIPIYSLGGIGVISVISNVYPKELSIMCNLLNDNNYKEALQIHNSLLDLMDAMFVEVNPIPVKYAVNLAGFKVGVPRLPLEELSSKNKIKLEKLMIKKG